MSAILLDVSRLIGRLIDHTLPTGVDRVGLEYIRHYGHRQSTRAVISANGFSAVLSRADSRRAFELLLEQDVARTLPTRMLMAKALLRAARRERFPRGILLHTSHSGIENARYFRSMENRGVRSVVMIHDIIPLTHPEYCRPTTKNIHQCRIRNTMAHAAGVVANSQFTIETLKSEAKLSGTPMPPYTVAHLAPGISERRHSVRPIEMPYFVMLGTIEPRKNHWFILHVWRRLAEIMGDATPRLVIIGRRGWECENAVDMLERCDELKGIVIEETACTDIRLHAYLQHAQALLFPSFVEGYGMPLIEALKVHTPVIASGLGVFREIAGDIPEYHDPLDGPNWLAAVQEYARNDSRARTAQLARIARFNPPSWAEHFECVDGFLDDLR
ncbi:MULTISPECIES: glycosyltransferase family 1 protein [unclassified Burkholderia]|uniref:glycosyltransferase family 4 protein n=1 Tax=unclassified Burkholderia TaxID=2613784 RepID=UPI000F56FED5|nr:MULTISPECIES: glycosyltransferase family 1 protein [unclassified Burkholderia]RQR44709.1 glycosyltransferase family 1 protein [Burkholderia sp. Bp9131]RQR70186.1 glycosyltransferase family 1 protein [Burkholderia sp. Bp9015]